MNDDDFTKYMYIEGKFRIASDYQDYPSSIIVEQEIWTEEGEACMRLRNENTNT